MSSSIEGVSVEELQLGGAGHARLDVDLAHAVGGEPGDRRVRRRRGDEVHALSPRPNARAPILLSANAPLRQACSRSASRPERIFAMACAARVVSSS